MVNTDTKVFIAMGFTTLGCFLSALSLILMKLSIERNNKGICNKLWMTGFSSLILGTVANILALGFGNLLLLASSSSLTLIFNSILSVKILHEAFSVWDGIAICLICSGSIACMFLVKEREGNLSETELKTLFTSTESLSYFGFGILVILAANFVESKVRRDVADTWRSIQGLNPIAAKPGSEIEMIE